VTSRVARIVDSVVACALAVVAATVLWSIILLGACGGAAPPDASTLRHGRHVTMVAGARVVAVERSTGDAVHLSLWVDAGSRDAEPPQLATVAAYVAREHAGDETAVEVLPDGTMFTRLCSRAMLAECAAGLLRALETRTADGAAVDRHLETLRAGRAAVASDPFREADAVALEALLGEVARTLFPLGRPDDDSQVSPRVVEGFLADHYGPERALLVAVGALDSSDLAAAIEGPLGALPAAGQMRRDRILAAGGIGDGVVVRVSDADVVSVAALAPNLPAAARAARGAHAAAGRGLTVNAFALRGGAIVLGRAEASPEEREALALDLIATTARGLESRAPDASLASEPETLAAAREEGMAWLAESEGPAPTPRIAVGVLVDGGRGDRVGSDDPEAALAAEVLATMRDIRARALAPARIHHSENRARATLSNGARIDAHRVAGTGSITLAVRSAGGAADDPPSLHGRMATLATVATHSCRMPLGFVAEPRVDADGWGVVVRGPAERWREALDAALDCTLRPQLARRTVEDARVAQLGALDPRRVARGWAASLVAPGMPGVVSPWGTAISLRTLRVEAVRRAHAAATAQGSTLSVAVLGDVEPAEVVRHAARTLARLPRGTVASANGPAPSATPPATEGLVAQAWDGPHPRVVVALRADLLAGARPNARSAGDAEAAARAVAELLGEALGRRSGIRIAHLDGGAARSTSFALVACDVTEDALVMLADWTRDALSNIDPAALGPAIERHRLEAQVARAAEPALVWDRASGRDESASSAATAMNAARALLRSAPAFAIGRSEPDR
jgi:predicted Zn-dependent peptidase